MFAQLPTTGVKERRLEPIDMSQPMTADKTCWAIVAGPPSACPSLTRTAAQVRHHGLQPALGSRLTRRYLAAS